MFETWELILHHTFSGTPGVAFDQSPKRGSHGAAVNMDPTDFLLDGRTNGSGAVQFRRDSYVSVTPTYGFDYLGAIRIEATFRCDDFGNTNHFIDTRPVSFFGAVIADQLDFGFKTDDAPGLSGQQRFAVPLQEAGIKPGDWITAAVAHDGFGTVVIAVDGRVVKTWSTTKLRPVRPAPKVYIGNTPDGPLPFRGLIDEVKVWRPNPHRITRDFTERVVKAGLTDCWKDWGTKFRDALDDLDAHDVECLHNIRKAVEDFQAEALPVILTKNAFSRGTWENAVAEYQRLWAAGDITAIHRVLTTLNNELRLVRINLESFPSYQALTNLPCLRELMGRLTPLDCDPDFRYMLVGEES